MLASDELRTFATTGYVLLPGIVPQRPPVNRRRRPSQLDGSPTSEGQYAVKVSKLPLTSHRSIPGFMKDTLAIRGQLRSARGLVGYALLAELGDKTFWTFSVWDSRNSLDEFARTAPHDRIIQALRPRMGKTVFKFDDVAGSRLPWGWDEVKRRLA